MDGFLPGEECQKCGGKCCREHGCSLSPKDMEQALIRLGFTTQVSRMDEEELNAAILTLLQKDGGNDLYAIDRFGTAAGPVFYLRMRHKCHTFIGVDAMGECIALTPEGCSLNTEQRPKGGRFLKSSPDGHCRQHYTQEMMKSDWSPYQKVLSDIWLKYEALFQSDGTFEQCDKAWFAFMRSERERAGKR